MKLSYNFGQLKVQRLKEQYDVFQWIVNLDDVIWNKNERFVTATNNVWEMICQVEMIIRKCYVNASEDQWEKLCILFGPSNVNSPSLYAFTENDPIVDFTREGWVDDAPTLGIGDITLANVHFSANSHDTTSLWHFIEEYYPHLIVK
ncbi:hypothetical protein Salat_0222000 [Sesamum alatum]|uniref:Uncharacterized protein n=1 Tax=Sesamum alatum TaxID=300844 RepID=A0AAE2CYM7_9LAMI|nr:hypothetical protein Salat_0222000 [Sesamum alatum]